jgi:3-hydroxyacyl-CoA dehydrogenase
MNTVSDEVLDGVQEASAAPRSIQGRGDLAAEGLLGRRRSGRPSAAAGGQIDQLESMVANFQRTSQRIKYALVPVVAAVRGLALGGGCEFQMHSAKTVAALESYIGLVEAGVGLLPAGGGLKELAARRAGGRAATCSPN